MAKIFAFAVWIIALIGWAGFGIDTLIKFKKDNDNWFDSFIIMQVMYAISVIANLIIKIV